MFLPMRKAGQIPFCFVNSLYIYIYIYVYACMTTFLITMIYGVLMAQRVERLLRRPKGRGFDPDIQPNFAAECVGL